MKDLDGGCACWARVAGVLHIAAIVVVATIVAGCTIRAVREAPIEDKSAAPRGAPSTATVTEVPAVSPAALPAQREASNGTYVVQRGDTLYSIAVAFSQDFRDIARWNGLDDPTKLSVGQALRVSPPQGEPGTGGVVVGVIATPPSSTAEARPLEAMPAPASAAPLPPSAPSAAVSPAMPANGGGEATAGARANEPAAAAVNRSGLLWQWPARGRVVDAYNETRNKGIDIAGADGEPVLAAGDGEIVYSGNGLRQYGNLVIVKHNDDFISAYAYNRVIVVKRGDAVRRGQRIAELGKSSDGQPRLHFEIRYRGKPVDPIKYLPPR